MPLAQTIGRSALRQQILQMVAQHCWGQYSQDSILAPTEPRVLFAYPDTDPKDAPEDASTRSYTPPTATSSLYGKPPGCERPDPQGFAHFPLKATREKGGGVGAGLGEGGGHGRALLMGCD